MNKQFFDIINDIDNIISQGPEKYKIESDLIHLLKEDAVNKYFFDNLNIEWLKPLYDSGYFKTPPEPIYDNDIKNYIYPPWTESLFLKRMAPKAPDKVLKIILEMKVTHNIHIHRNLIDAALAMPPEISVKMINKVISWIDAPSVRWYPEGYGKLIGNLARGNQIEGALELARSLFELSIVEEAKKYETKPESKFNDYWYKEILEQITPILAEKAGMRLLTLFSDLLENAIKLTGQKNNALSEELFYYSGPPAIEDHEQNNYHDDPIDTLIFTVRKIAERLIEKYGREVLKEIEKHEYTVFKRIGIHLRWKWPEVDLLGTRKILSDIETFKNDDLYHERHNLLRVCFGKLKSDEQAVYLKYIDKGIDKELTAENYRRFFNEELSKEDIEEKERSWKYMQLYPISEYIDNLSESWKNKFQELRNEFGEKIHPDFERYISTEVGSGYRPPKSREQLAEMSMDELITFLKDIEVSDQSYDDVFEGTGIILKDLTLADPEKFATESERFKGFQPPFISGLFDGVQQSIKNNSKFDTQLWKPILSLCKWVVEQPRDVQLRKGRYAKLDPNWGWTRKSIVSLLETGFKSEVSCIPYEYRELSWNVLFSLTEDPDPTTERESDETISFDPATVAINSTRGMAMHTVLFYAIWIRQYLSKQPNGESELSKGLDSIQEVKEVLEKHLDMDNDSSYAIRSFYGQMFPWLVQIDEKWATQHIDKIFPREQSYSKFRDTAWESFIMFNRPNSKVFKLLKEQYIYGIERIGTWPEIKPRFADPDERLADHLITLYWHNEIDLDDPKEFLPRFYEKASDSLKGHAIEFIGRNLSNANESILPRLMDLWNKRIIQAESGKPKDFEKEFTSFGNWFFPPVKFDDQWMIAQLKKVLKLYKKIEMDHLVSEWLSALSEKYPLDTVSCLSLMIEGSKEVWNIDKWEDDERIILSNAIKSENEKARKSAIDLVNRIGALGYLEFRDLLKK